MYLYKRVYYYGVHVHIAFLFPLCFKETRVINLKLRMYIYILYIWTRAKLPYYQYGSNDFARKLAVMSVHARVHVQ